MHPRHHRFGTLVIGHCAEAYPQSLPSKFHPLAIGWMVLFAVFLIWHANVWGAEEKKLNLYNWDTYIGENTVSDFSKIEYNLKIPDDVFTERYLRRAPRKWLR